MMLFFACMDISALLFIYAFYIEGFITGDAHLLTTAIISSIILAVSILPQKVILMKIEDYHSGMWRPKVPAPVRRIQNSIQTRGKREGR